MRLLGPIIAVTTGLATLVGCSSSSSPGGSTSPSTPTTTVQTAPTTSAPTPVAKPAGEPSTVKRTVSRPPGAKVVDVGTCIAASNIAILFIEQSIFDVPDRQLQLAHLSEVATVAAGEKQHLTKARRVWRSDGYPAGFPVVRDLDTYLDIYSKIIATAKTHDLDSIPDLYLKLKTVDKQYGDDIRGSGVCQA